jgi:hypothetical protein
MDVGGFLFSVSRSLKLTVVGSSIVNQILVSRFISINADNKNSVKQ